MTNTVHHVKVFLLSELEFEHQVTMLGGRGHESTEVLGFPEDGKQDGGRGMKSSGEGGRRE